MSVKPCANAEQGLAAQRPLQALVLVATFTDLPALAAGYPAPGFLARDVYDNLAVVRSFEGPGVFLSL